MKYQLTIRGYGRDLGAGQITREQYEYWTAREDELGEALNDNYEYVDEDGEPLADEAVAKVSLTYYNEYEDYFAGGADLDACNITITDEEGNEIFNGDYSQYTEEFDPQGQNDVVYEDEEIYYSDFKPGFYVIWGQGAKGTFTDLEFETELPFDGTKLRIGYTDWEGQSIITALSYDGDEFDTYEGLDNWGKWAEYEIREIT
jgi:hypothetical protein